MAQIAANRVAGAGCSGWSPAYGRAGTLAVRAAALQDYTERLMRATIRAIPDGEYTFEDALDDDGFGAAPVAIRAPCDDPRRRRRGRFHRVDPAGGRQRQRQRRDHAVGVPVRVPLPGGRRRAVQRGRGAADDRRGARRHGRQRRAGRRRWRAATSRRRSGSPTSCFGALGQALPDRMPAASQGTMNNVTMGGVDPATGRRFAYYETIGGGMGGAARPDGPRRRAHPHEQHAQHARRGDRTLPADPHPAVRAAARQRRGRRRAGRRRPRARVRGACATSVTVLSERRQRPPYGAAGGAPAPAGATC